MANIYVDDLPVYGPVGKMVEVASSMEARVYLTHRHGVVEFVCSCCLIRTYRKFRYAVKFGSSVYRIERVPPSVSFQKAITGDHSKQDLRYTQKKTIYLPTCTINNNIWSYLLWSSAIGFFFGSVRFPILPSAPLGHPRWRRQY